MSNMVHELDLVELDSYLTKHVEGFSRLTEIEKFSVGQSNPTFLLHADSGKYVLRRQPPGKLLKSAHMVDREFRVMHALAQTEVPVPTMYHLCEDPQVLGSLFYVMSFADGTMRGDPGLPELEKPQRAGYHHQLIKTLAAIHNVDLAQTGLTDYGKGSGFFERQIALWTRQYRASETEVCASMENLIEWLPANLPADDGQVTLIHGDFKFDNMLFDNHSDQVIAVLDWELSTLGHPVSDLAYLCMCNRLPAFGFLKGLGGRDRAEQGVPSEDELVTEYCQLRGIDQIEHWNFYLAFSFFRLASISQGVYKRYLSGNASSEHGVLAGEVAETLADMGMQLT